MSHFFHVNLPGNFLYLKNGLVPLFLVKICMDQWSPVSHETKHEKSPLINSGKIRSKIRGLKCRDENSKRIRGNFRSANLFSPNLIRENFKPW